MIEQPKRHFLILLPIWVIPVFLITFGSLINFHQNRIWGEQLLPYSFVTPRDKAKVLKIQDIKNYLTDFFVFDTQDETLLCLPAVQVNYTIISDQSGFRLLRTSSPRGPPIA
ncbi:MAG: hypothetical protein ISR57_03895 [Bacteroidales bacterium]|nr:hypothetical protein [Bacteroidales bacterium]